MEDLGTCAVRDCTQDAAVDLGSFGLCVAHEGRRLGGAQLTIRQRRTYGGGVVSFVELTEPAL